MDGWGATLFDASWYIDQLSEPLPPGSTALDHFCSSGFFLGISPSPLIRTVLGAPIPPLRLLVDEGWSYPLSRMIDLPYYASHYPDVSASGMHPLEHLVRVGLAQNRTSYPLFDSTYYHERTPEASGKEFSALLHYLKFGGLERRDFHPLFDNSHYEAQFPESVTRGRHLLLHYIGLGEVSVSPHPGFDAHFYLSANPDAKASGLKALDHYLASGDREGKAPHPFFDPAYYRQATGDRLCDPRSDLQHYCETGLATLASPHPIFDPAWYERSVQTEDHPGLPPWLHYIVYGAREQAAPHPLFSPEYYTRSNPDVAAEGICPILHYLERGAQERRDPHPLFDTRFYLDQHHQRSSEIPNALIDYLGSYDQDSVTPHPLFDPVWYESQVGPGKGFLHFVSFGDVERQSPHPLFDPVFYCRDLTLHLAQGPTRHFCETGWKEDRRPHAMFDAQHYRIMNPDCVASAINPLVHYLRSESPSRHPHPLFDGLAYSASSALVGHAQVDPLSDYVNTRSSLDSQLVLRGSTTVPEARKAFLPERRPPIITTQDDLMSIIIPTYNSPHEYLSRCIDSIRSQDFSAWELLLVDDGSTDPSLAPMLSELACKDNRIRVSLQSYNSGISAATNRGLELARGRYVAFVDHDDVVMPEALGLVYERLAREQADICYTDQAYVTAWNSFDGGFHKADWSPTLLTGVMYVGHLLVVRTDLARRVGGLDAEFDRVQDFEFMLRLSEHTKKISHIDEILYHWRRIPGSIAFDGSAKGKIEHLQSEAVNRHFDRTKVRVRAEPHPALAHRLRLSPMPMAQFPQVDVIVLGDLDPPRAAYLRSRAASMSIAVAEATGSRSLLPSDWFPKPDIGAAIEAAVSAHSAPLILIVHPNVSWPEVEEWIDYLAMYCEQPDVLSAAPTLFDDAGACVVSGSVLDGGCGLVPAMSGLAINTDGHAGSLSCNREVTAHHGSLVMLNRSLWLELGGLDPRYKDPYYLIGDLAVRGRGRGMRNIAVAYPPARINAGKLVESGASLDQMVFMETHADTISAGDPYHSPK